MRACALCATTGAQNMKGSRTRENVIPPHKTFFSHSIRNCMAPCTPNVALGEKKAYALCEFIPRIASGRPSTYIGRQLPTSARRSRITEAQYVPGIILTHVISRHSKCGSCGSKVAVIDRFGLSGRKRTHCFWIHLESMSDSPPEALNATVCATGVLGDESEVTQDFLRRRRPNHMARGTECKS